MRSLTIAGFRSCRRFLWPLLLRLYGELSRTRAFSIAAALAFYSLLSLVPLLIAFSSLLGHLALPSLFGQLMSIIRTLVPHDAVVVIEHAAVGIRTAPHARLFSFGVLGYLWAASGGFSASIEALDIAYDVELHRPWWRDRLQALLLTLTTGLLMTLSLLAQVLGPRFGRFLEEWLLLPQWVSVLWPFFRLCVTFVTFTIAVEILYFLGPNIRRSFASTMPGAVTAVAGWFLGSMGLKLYLAHVSNYSSAYGSLGAVIGLMLWFYLVALSTLLGAELNAELIKDREQRERDLCSSFDEKKTERNIA